MKAILYLEDGTYFYGENFGAQGEVTGEVVFNTSMTGYQEILTDPSYTGQMVTMTYPEIGNYGVNEEDVESDKVQVSAFIVKNYNEEYFNFRAQKSLGKYLKENNIIGIENIDTRSLTKKIREEGSMNGIISTEEFDLEILDKKVKEAPDMEGMNLVDTVTTKEVYKWNKLDNKKEYNVVVYDYGVKFNILRILEDLKCDLTVVPSDYPAEKVLDMDPDGIFLSNGPGDPAAVDYAIENIKKLKNKKPIFGICLGHQLAALSLGGKTYKMKFGHRGANQSVIDMDTKKVDITSQNHGFAVDMDSLEGMDLKYINLNDNSSEGMVGKDILTVQHHPEASPGPHDSFHIFNDFIKMMEMNKNGKKESSNS
ncbi:MAG: glutamine-hydrolyzing carbamoyl-phosphate synthase small subunit [Fusobacteriota bacterium]